MPETTSYEDRIKNELHNYSSQLAGRESETEVVRFSQEISAFSYASSFYSPYVSEKMPNINVDGYLLRTAEAADRPLRILSLGCGTGDWEFDVCERSSGKIEFELMDLNEHLMAMATRLAEKKQLPIRTSVGDANKLQLKPLAYDYVLCRSSLHHFLELEHLFGEIRKSLRPRGAFVVIGEFVGRNGLQLYPETELAAQRIFDTLPDRLRHNCYTNEIDTVVPNIDHSVDSFEAIRSQDIVPQILRYFEPVEYVMYDAYLSLLFDFRYGPNYDLTSEEDRAIIERIATADLWHVKAGTLRPTAMSGIFRC